MKKIILGLMLGLLFNPNSATAGGYLFISDASWKSFNQYVDGWNQSGFDDSSWRNAYENYVGSLEVWGYIIPTIWDWPYPGIPNGANGPIEAYFRKTITLNGPVNSALLHIGVDDEMDLYVNGVLAFRDRSGGSTVVGNLPISSSLFSEGENVIAIYAFDGGGTPYDRSGETVYLAFEIQTEDCLISIATLSGENGTINPLPLAGQTAALTATVSGGVDTGIIWSLLVDDLVVLEGSGLPASIGWDGRNSAGEIEPGIHELTLLVSSENSSCVAEAHLTAFVEITDDCELRISFQ